MDDLSLIYKLGTLAGVQLISAMSPGPSFFFISRVAISTTRQRAFIAALGLAVGATIWASFVLKGLDIFLIQFPKVYSGLEAFGGIYLISIAIGLLKDSNGTGANQRQIPDAGPARIFWKSLLMQMSNPKVALFYSSIFASFLPTASDKLFHTSTPCN